MMKMLPCLLTLALAPVFAEDGTVRLSAVPVFNENAKDSRGPAVVVDVIEGTPAAKAGIRAGDFIVAVNGADLEGKSAVETLAVHLAGAPGGQVKLAIWRQSEGRQFTADLTRVAYPLRANRENEKFRYYRPANWRPEVDAFPLP